MPSINKIKLQNFRKFRRLEINLNPQLNTIIGDNESGKSTILQAIELVASGSRHKVEAAGMESLLNKSCIDDFQGGNRTIENLPILRVELFLSNAENPDLVGRNNTDDAHLSGLHMICEPNLELSREINQALAQDNNFPYEHYIVRFITFNGEPYSSYRRFVNCLAIDSSLINNEYANREYIKKVYDSVVEYPQRVRLKNEYRQRKVAFGNENLNEINGQIEDYDFAIRSGTKYNLETDLTLMQDQIPIDERGKGQQCFIKTNFALTRNANRQNIDLILLEEPENHLSHTNMNRLISKISNSHNNQIIIATHSSLISSRLDLRNSILLNSTSNIPLTLSALTDSTAKFFMKAPDSNILEFVLSSKVILVEGDAEYILMDALYTKTTGRTLEEDGVHIISVGGTSFKRYMELARTLGIRTAVVRDNDENYEANCVARYTDHIADYISVFADRDNERYTFEVCIYAENEDICGQLFSGGGIQKAPLEYMIDNKAESALRLLDNHADDLIVPVYIQEAIEWINA